MGYDKRWFEGCEEWMGPPKGHWLEVTPTGLPPGPEPARVRWKREARLARVAKRLLENPEMWDRLVQAYKDCLLYGRRV